MTNVIVTTTINAPTEAIRRFDAMKDWHLVVVGDLKTPENYALARGTYFGPKDQEKFDSALSYAIGWNCIQRRNFGLLIARDMGAEVVALVDDDNIPNESWGKNVAVGQEIEVHYYETDLPAFDPIGATNHTTLWHRGFPLQLISRRDYSKCQRQRLQIDVQADFWNGDPDIDAICRMEHAPECDFDKACFPIASNKFSPFDSQNTFLSAKLLPDYFLFPHIGRMDDIWASYYVQAKGFRVAFCAPSVYQKRNPHDLTADLRQELLGYEHTLALVVALARDAESIVSFLPTSAWQAFELYRRHFKCQ
jgi:hypothetical protein